MIKLRRDFYIIALVDLEEDAIHLLLKEVCEDVGAEKKDCRIVHDEAS